MLQLDAKDQTFVIFSRSYCFVSVESCMLDSVKQSLSAFCV